MALVAVALVALFPLEEVALTFGRTASFAGIKLASRIRLAIAGEFDYMRRSIAPLSALFTGPRWTTSRPWASRFLKIRKEKHDVDYC